MTTCIVAVRLGQALGFDEATLRAEVISKVDSAGNDKLMALMLRFMRNTPEPALTLRMAQAIANNCAQLP